MRLLTWLTPLLLVVEVAALAVGRGPFGATASPVLRAAGARLPSRRPSGRRCPVWWPPWCSTRSG
ncbi:MAG: hypothetical protein M3P96_05595 [Actinomycetota bacterium]|nr:hypothetical protein [Actinomycetota bacterium]